MLRLLPLSAIAFAVALAIFGVQHFGPAKALVASEAPGRGALIDPPHKPGSSWSKKLNPDGKIYENGFRTFYFDRTAGASRVFEDHAESVAVKYAWDKLHGIKSETFAGYWIGQVEYRHATTRQISVSLSWSKARVFIDGVLVHDSGSEKTFTHEFSAGAHLIEVEYINNWHTTEFKLTIDEVIEVRSADQIRNLLDLGNPDSADVYYVGLYESDRQDTSVDVRLPRTGRPAILWLDSYEAIDWKVSAPDGLAAAIVGSYSPGSRVKGAETEAVYHVDKRFGVHSSERSGCRCTAGSFHCEQKEDLQGVAEELRRITGRRLAGYFTQYNASTVTIRRWNAAESERIEGLRLAAAQAEKQCRSVADPDFDTMLD